MAIAQSSIDLLSIVCFFGCYLLIFKIVRRQKFGHIRRQNTLLERCRTHYLLAVKYIELGNDDVAENYLKRIRRVEDVWRIGNSKLLRWAVSLKAAAYATIAAVSVRLMPIFLWRAHSDPLLYRSANGFSESDVTAILFFSILPLLHALAANSEVGWYDLRFISDAGDRLERLLHGPRALASFQKSELNPPPSLDGLSAYQVLGLDSSYTRAQLTKARQRMARQFHPDIWANAAPAERHASNEAMKRVNAAYDELSAAH
jgi:hypothetical protein